MNKTAIAALLISVAMPLPLLAQDKTAPGTVQDNNAPAVMDDSQTGAATDMKKGDANTSQGAANTTNDATSGATATDNAQTQTDMNADKTMQTTQAAGAGDTFVTVPESGAWRVSDLEGKAVYDAKGENIGDIKDVLVSQDGSVNAVIIGVGGFLGIGQKDVAVSMSALEFGPGMTPEEINAAANSSSNPAVSGETTASTQNNAADGTAADPAMTNNDMAANPADPNAANPNAANDQMAANNTAAVQVGDDALPTRIVLNVTREQLEQAPAFEGVRANANANTAQ